MNLLTLRRRAEVYRAASILKWLMFCFIMEIEEAGNAVSWYERCKVTQQCTVFRYGFD